MFIIRIPLTLAIIDGMKVEIGNEIYIIPSLNIKVFRSGSYEIVKILMVKNIVLLEAIAIKFID